MKQRDWQTIGLAQLNEKQMFERMLIDMCSSIRTPKTKGRSFISWGDMMLSSASMVYNNKSSRGYQSFINDLLERGIIGNICTPASISNFLKKEEVSTILLGMIRKLSLPFVPFARDFAIDSTGIGTDHKSSYCMSIYRNVLIRKDYLKVHVCADVERNVVTDVIISGKGSDCPYMIPLLEKTRENFSVQRVFADKAYWSDENFEFVDSLGGKLFVPPKSNSRVSSRHSRMMDETIETAESDEWLDQYHLRSNVEAVFSSIKRRFGGFVRGKHPTVQRNEILLKILCHNICCLIKFYAEMKGPVLFESI